jgi:hypothetical protein
VNGLATSNLRVYLVLIILLALTKSSIAEVVNLPDTTAPIKSLLHSITKKFDRGRDSVNSLNKYLSQGSPNANSISKPLNDTIGKPRKKLEDQDYLDDVVDPTNTLCFGGKVQDVEIVPDLVNPKKLNAPAKEPFIKIHGNILYDANFHSSIDTPYAEKNVYQHTIQTYLDILIKNQYPFRIFLTNRYSNSNWYTNASDFNISYTNTQFSQLIKETLRKEAEKQFDISHTKDSLLAVLKNKLAKFHSLDGLLHNPALIQRQVEFQERQMLGPGGSTSPSVSDTLKGIVSGKSIDTLNKKVTRERNDIDSFYLSKIAESDSLKREIAVLESSLSKFSTQEGATRQDALNSIDKINSPATLEKSMSLLNLNDSILPKGYQTLMAVKSFGIGRSAVNYSDLSVKNISVTGLQAEYNPNNYYALAAGSVDYRFRDFMVPQQNPGKQYLAAFRYGFGMKDGNNIIITYFTGKRQLFNTPVADSVHVVTPSNTLSGITIEGNYHITKQIIFTGEIAKSTIPAYVDSSKGSNPGQMFQFQDRSNEAYSLKLTANIPTSQTRFKATYKRLGINYQSFSVFTDGSAQTIWSASINQLLFRRQLEISISANTNDFSNPYINQQYSSTTVFKSIQATLRKRNWPIISLGYYPSSQIMKLSSGQLTENLFYTLVGNITDTYQYREAVLNSTIVYTQFYNRSTDTGFVYFNTKNILVSQSFTYRKSFVMVNLSGATNQSYQLYTIEGKLQQNISSVLMLGAGLKYNEQTNYNIRQIGYSVEIGLKLSKVGQIVFSADKGFIPGWQNQLVPNNTGRLTYFKIF